MHSDVNFSLNVIVMSVSALFATVCSSSAEQVWQRDLQRSLMWGYVPLDYIVEASTMQSMGIYTCLKAWLFETTPLQRNACGALTDQSSTADVFAEFFRDVLALLTSNSSSQCPSSLLSLIVSPCPPSFAFPSVFALSVLPLHLLFTSLGSHWHPRAFWPSWSWWRESEY